nr:cadmium metallothionein-like [Cherax quadricarinatus]
MDVKLCKNPLANNTCIGSDCICCDKCSINPVCDEGYGVCRAFCLKQEQEVKNGCGDSACKCCSPRLATCHASNNCSGICTDVRKCTNPLTNNFCSGLNCVCCDKCNAQPFCNDGNGVCREACHSQEREIENGCSVSGCKCCTLQVATCNASAQCPGMCVDSRKCTKPLHNSRCSGRHCICCDKCNAQPFCNGGHGVCRNSCLSHEREDEGSSCGESGCKCCTVRLAVCLSSNNCSGICLDSSLCTNPIANSSCSGDYCVCCDSK